MAPPSGHHRFAPESLAAIKREPSACLASSTDAGWRSGLLRIYRSHGSSDPFETVLTPDQTVVVHLAGRSEIKCFGGGVWRSGVTQPGTVGLTPAGETSRLQWRSLDDAGYVTAHLQLPASLIEEAADHLHRPGRRSDPTHLNALAIGDAPTAVLVRTLSEGLASGATELFAETILLQLAQRLLDPERPGDREPFYDPRRMRDAERRLRRAVEFMSADLAAQHSLDTIAREAGISKFHFARLFREALGCAPYGFMTALRLDTAKQMLATSDLPISTIAAMVGYPVARNFTAAFRRHHKQRPDAVARMASH